MQRETMARVRRLQSQVVGMRTPAPALPSLPLHRARQHFQKPFKSRLCIGRIIRIRALVQRAGNFKPHLHKQQQRFLDGRDLPHFFGPRLTGKFGITCLSFLSHAERLIDGPGRGAIV